MCLSSLSVFDVVCKEFSFRQPLQHASKEAKKKKGLLSLPNTDGFRVFAGVLLEARNGYVDDEFLFLVPYASWRIAKYVTLSISNGCCLLLKQCLVLVVMMDSIRNGKR
mmetsp:Transcript_16962/g.46586  ORF Transcript_16962/g.46586 Transcript_16962/m.46586 type:complete len:109 (+) Transcript_16962:1176-1502(+)